MEEIAEGDYCDNRKILKLNKKGDRLLFKKNMTTICEYQLRDGKCLLLKEYRDDKFVIEDFSFSPKKEKDEQVLMISKEGVIAMASVASQKAKKFALENSTLNLF